MTMTLPAACPRSVSDELDLVHVPNTFWSKGAVDGIGHRDAGILVIDGWSWKSGHNAIAYEEIRNLVKSLQPNCLLTDHTHLADPWEVDIANVEEPAGGFAPANNTYAAQQEQKINASGGNDWFWAPNIGGLMTVTSIVDGHLKMLEPRWTNFILNCPPNRDGLLDAAIVTRLAEVGAA